MKISSSLSSKLSNLSIICAVLVVMIHADNCWPQLFYCRHIFRETLPRCAVPLFFAISGFLLAKNYGEQNWYSRALRKRSSSILLPYVIWSVIYFIFYLFIDILGNIIHKRTLMERLDFTPTHILSSLGFNPFEAPIPGQFWYLRALIILVILSPILFIAIRKIGIIIPVILYIISFFISDTFFPSKWTTFFSDIIPFSAGLPYFTFGAFLAIKGSIKPPPLIPSFIVACLLAVSRLIALLKGAEELATIIQKLYIPFFAITLWHITPEKVLPKSITSLAFPIFIIHIIWIKNFELFITPKTCTTFMFFAKTIFATILSGITAYIIRRCFPRASSVLFGGR